MYFFLKRLGCIVYFNIIFSCFIFGASNEIQELMCTYSDDRNYTEVCWLTAHNAYANYEDGWVMYYQQNSNFENQYQFGVRSFMIDLYWYHPKGKRPYIAMCHETSGDNDGGCVLSSLMRVDWEQKGPESLEFFLLQIKAWLQKDQRAIITLHLESYLKDIDWLDDKGEKRTLRGLEELQRIFRKVGLDEYLYVPIHLMRDSSVVSEWLTLGEMRVQNRRLVIFSDRKTDGVIYTKSYRETQFDLHSFPNCEMRFDNRDNSTLNSPMRKKLLVLNHFYSLSTQTTSLYYRGFAGIVSQIYDAYQYGIKRVFDVYSTINSFHKIMSRVNQCHGSEDQGMLPNFIAVDFVEVGGARKVVTKLNQRPKKDFHTPAVAMGVEEDEPHGHDEL